MYRTNPVIFMTNQDIFGTNSVKFRINPVLLRKNLVIFMTNSVKLWDDQVTFRTIPAIFSTHIVILWTNPIILSKNLVICWTNPFILRLKRAIFRYNPVIFNTNTVIFRINSVIPRRNPVTFGRIQSQDMAKICPKYVPGKFQKYQNLLKKFTKLQQKSKFTTKQPMFRAKYSGLGKVTPKKSVYPLQVPCLHNAYCTKNTFRHSTHICTKYTAVQ